MLCEFTQIGEQDIICVNCGRRAQHDHSKKFFPVAKCRIPETYDYQKYKNGKRNKEVGDFLSDLLRGFGYEYDPISSGRTRITFLNAKGLRWAEKHQHIIVSWLSEESAKKQIPVLPKLFAALVKLAIRRTKQYKRSLSMIGS